jgi:ribosomal protein L11 methyltransferase
MVFGTGHHATTKRCLSIIDKFSEVSDKKKNFLDVGTGTGILAIAAARLGFTHVIGIDVDPLAVDAALRNVELSSLNNVEIREGDITSVDGAFDVIAANLLAETFVNIDSKISSLLYPDGIAILSGMLAGQEDNVIEAMERSGLILKDNLRDENWITLVFS